MTKSKKSDFHPDQFVVYPAHGVGKILSIEEQEIAGLRLELFVISFEKDKMTLRVPTHKATEIGMRSLSSPDVVTKAREYGLFIRPVGDVVVFMPPLVSTETELLDMLALLRKAVVAVTEEGAVVSGGGGAHF